MSKRKPKITFEAEEDWRRKVKSKAILEGKKLKDFLIEATEMRLLLSAPLNEFLDAVIPRAKEFFNGEPAAITVWESGGISYGSALYHRIKEANTILINLSDPESLKPNLVQRRKVAIVSDSTHSGKSFEAIRKKLIEELEAKEVILLVYEDFGKKADLAAKRQTKEEHINSLLSLLDYLKS